MIQFPPILKERTDCKPSRRSLDFSTNFLDFSTNETETTIRVISTGPGREWRKTSINADSAVGQSWFLDAVSIHHLLLTGTPAVNQPNSVSSDRT
jgi:hypothetical protein